MNDEENTGENSQLNNEWIDVLTKCLNSFTVYPVVCISCDDFQKLVEHGYAENGRYSSGFNHVFNIVPN